MTNSGGGGGEEEDHLGKQQGWLLPGETLLYSVDAECGMNPGTLFFTDFRLVWVPADDEGAAVSAPYLLVEDAAWTARALRLKLELKDFRRIELRFSSSAAPPTPATPTLSRAAGAASTTLSGAGATATQSGGRRKSASITTSLLAGGAGPVRCWAVVERLVRGFALCGFRPERLFAFRSTITSISEGWDVYDARADWARLGVPCGQWRVSTANSAFGLCAGLPPLLVVPANLSDARLAALASVRVDGRLPVVVWRSPETHAVIVRTSPLTQAVASFAASSASSASTSSSRLSPLEEEGLEADRELMEAVRLAGGKASMPLAVVDCRSRKAAGAAVPAAGVYARCNYACLALPGVDALRESRTRLRRLLAHAQKRPGTHAGASQVAATGWLQAVQQTLAAASRVVAAVAAGGSAVVLCATGCDHAAAVSALAQLLLDAHSRTRRGFAALVEKEWLHAGHWFEVRHGHARLEDSRCAPLFLLFLDCVWQLANQFPCAFEFGERLLLALADEAYACRTGTFLVNSLQQRLALALPARTPSFWAEVVDSSSSSSLYTNTRYVPTPDTLFPRTTPRHVLLWTAYYLRYRPLVLDRVGRAAPLTAAVPPAVVQALARPPPEVPQQQQQKEEQQKEQQQQKHAWVSVVPSALGSQMRSRAISSHTALARAFAAAAFTAENDAGARPVAAGQELFVLERTTAAEWLVSLDRHRSFLARVPARLLTSTPPPPPPPLPPSQPDVPHTEWEQRKEEGKVRVKAMGMRKQRVGAVNPAWAASPGTPLAQRRARDRQFARTLTVLTRDLDSAPSTPSTLSPLSASASPSPSSPSSPRRPYVPSDSRTVPLTPGQSPRPRGALLLADDAALGCARSGPTFTVKRDADPTRLAFLQVFYRFFDRAAPIFIGVSPPPPPAASDDALAFAIPSPSSSSSSSLSFSSLSLSASLSPTPLASSPSASPGRFRSPLASASHSASMSPAHTPHTHTPRTATPVITPATLAAGRLGDCGRSISASALARERSLSSAARPRALAPPSRHRHHHSHHRLHDSDGGIGDGGGGGSDFVHTAGSPSPDPHTP